VRLQKQEGWMHGSALTKKKIVLKPTAQDMEQMAAEPDSIALAGKGIFNADSEKGYRQKYTTANYAAVDAMEKIVIAPKQMAAFIQQGELTPQGGAQ
jgi:hypothetical protein